MFNLCFSGAKVEGMNFITVAGIFHFYYQTGCRYGVIAVSYTHLTLPTKLEV